MTPQLLQDAVFDKKESVDLVIPPSVLNFVTTNKCTSACYNCCFKCNPQNKDRLTLSDMKNYINQAISAYSSLKIVVFTGGECFTLGKSLEKIIEYSHSKGLAARVVTNAYWAATLEKAEMRLKPLVDAGLTEVNISTGDEHQKWVSLNNIVNAIIASLELGMSTAVNIETSESSNFNADIFRNDDRLKKYINLYEGKKLFLLSSAWMPFTKSTKREKSIKKNQSKKIILSTKYTHCTSLFNTISINPVHQVYACCGLTSECIPYLRLGNAMNVPLPDLYEYQFKDFLKIWLYVEGPKKVLNFCLNKRTQYSVNVEDMHLCQACAELFNNEQNIEILQSNYKEVFSNIMLKYYFINKN